MKKWNIVTLEEKEIVKIADYNAIILNPDEIIECNGEIYFGGPYCIKPIIIKDKKWKEDKKRENENYYDMAKQYFKYTDEDVKREIEHEKIREENEKRERAFRNQRKFRLIVTTIMKEYRDNIIKDKSISDETIENILNIMERKESVQDMIMNHRNDYTDVIHKAMEKAIKEYNFFTENKEL